MQLWFLLVAVQAASWAFCAGYLASTFQTVWTRHAGSKLWGFCHAMVPTLLLALSLYAYSSTAGSIRPDRLGGVTLNQGPSFATFGVILALCAVAGMFFVRHALLDVPPTNGPDLSRFIFLKSRLQVFLNIAALTLSLGILGTAAMRSAVNAENGETYFPAEYVIMYGAIFTLLLLIAYVPVKMSFWAFGSDLAAELMSSPPNTSPDLVKWLEDKGKLEKALDLDLTSLSALVGPIAAILPVLSGWIAILLGGTKH